MKNDKTARDAEEEAYLLQRNLIIVSQEQLALPRKTEMPNTPARDDAPGKMFDALAEVMDDGRSVIYAIKFKPRPLEVGENYGAHIFYTKRTFIVNASTSPAADDTVLYKFVGGAHRFAYYKPEITFPRVGVLTGVMMELFRPNNNN